MRLLTLSTTPPATDLHPLTSSGLPATRVPVDVYRVEDSLLLRCDLPGIPPDDIVICVRGQRLHLRARRLPSEHRSDVFLSERFCGLLYRTLDLPLAVDPEGALADLDEGILTVTLPLVDDIEAPLDPVAELSGPTWEEPADPLDELLGDGASSRS